MANQALTNNISENYKTLRVLGQGCYGHVIKCFKRDTQETVAVKVLKQRYSKYRKIKEVFILEKLRCLDPDKYNIVRYHEWFHRIDRTFMVFEMLDMSLYDYMTKTKWAPVPLNGIRTIITDVATALNALKGVGLIHADLKLANIMLVDHYRQPFRVKLIDFGLTLQTSEVRPGVGVQPFWYRSPEIILGLPFTEAIDIWSLGSMMAETLLGFPLFPGRSDYDMLQLISDLLGEPSKRFLNGGINTKLFYHRSRKYLVSVHWTFKTPEEFHTERGIEPMKTRRHRFSSLDELKTLSLLQENSTDAADRSACVELLKEMLQIDPRDRITPSQILAHPFITRSYLSPSNSSQNETAAAETSRGQAVSNTKDTAETTADYSPQAVQKKKMADCPKAKDDRDLILDPVNDRDITHDSGLKLDSITDSAKTSPAVDYDMSIQSVPPNSRVEAPDSVWNQASNSINTLHMSEVSEPKKKKKKKRIRGFFSALKRKFFSCFHVPEDDDE
ncbi:homeodomain-interacting protein kinase 2-like [Siniperca chuatsi]|uniref:homeodomain-interacting protein kinase 2-like n=1 Tax=Siniperca chuatsi TaxID=119488 RepID=UPI001CE0A0F1|nr:homeodomain-interacting protein kinase 2-like [Siniperca chuatsi]XP_044066306.1 homeodomain-interacting protein kinase 2-like [Siniperca chuatsi]